MRKGSVFIFQFLRNDSEQTLQVTPQCRTKGDRTAQRLAGGFALEVFEFFLDNRLDNPLGAGGDGLALQL